MTSCPMWPICANLLPRVLRASTLNLRTGGIRGVNGSQVHHFLAAEIREGMESKMGKLEGQRVGGSQPNNPRVVEKGLLRKGRRQTVAPPANNIEESFVLLVGKSTESGLLSLSNKQGQQSGGCP